MAVGRGRHETAAVVRLGGPVETVTRLPVKVTGLSSWRGPTGVFEETGQTEAGTATAGGGRGRGQRRETVVPEVVQVEGGGEGGRELPDR